MHKSTQENSNNIYFVFLDFYTIYYEFSKFKQISWNLNKKWMEKRENGE
jgi:hypothetical protein